MIENAYHLFKGIAAAGSGFGQLALSPMLDFIISKVGMVWTFAILGAIAATGVFFGLAYLMPSKDEDTNF